MFSNTISEIHNNFMITMPCNIIRHPLATICKYNKNLTQTHIKTPKCKGKGYCSVLSVQFGRIIANASSIHHLFREADLSRIDSHPSQMAS